MKSFSFPIFKTKTEGETRVFALDDPVERRKYFDLKARAEIEKLRNYLKNNTFVGFLLGKKNSGKGTYSKLFAEAVGQEYIRHISVGDIVRAVHEDFSDESKKRALMELLRKSYRGSVPLDDAVNALLGRSTSTLLPTELILTLVEREISKTGHRAIFIDGFPRSLDQVSYSLYFRHIMGYRDDPDFFVFIDVPEEVINERIKYRVVCPECHTPRSTKLLRTKEVGYDAEGKNFYLKCDNPSCNEVRMVSKEGDDLGVEAIRNRIEADDEVMRILLKLEGVKKVYLRNSIPASVAKEYVDDYEITPAYRYEWDEGAGKVRVIEEPWEVKVDGGVPSYSLLPPPVVVSLIVQTAKVLGL